ncbi:LTA synthase family protein [Virgibacillus kekensis]|uniref:LTA synthase family protein n=1 Tax=Virgibacillus kekensis TaxID=202261 RepID=A0ABV9DFV9_9BACI
MRMFKEFISNNLILSVFLFLWLKTVIATFICFDLTILNWLDVVSVILAPAGILMLGIGLSFFFSKRVKPVLLLSIIVLVTGLLYANILYYRFYIDFVTVSVLLQLSNVGGIGPSTAELFTPWDILLIADIFVLGRFIIRKRKRGDTISRPPLKKYCYSGGVLLLVTFSLGIIQQPTLLKTQYDREQLVSLLGIYNYQIVNSVYGVKAPISEAFTDSSDIEKIDHYLANKQAGKGKHYGEAKGRNVILISMESTQNFVINQTVNGEEITPFLNDLIEKSYYFSNIYDQTAQGKTSDSEFLVDTGLYPLPSGSVFVRRPENSFNALPEILKSSGGYTTASLHGNDREFWNREAMYNTLGYDYFFSKRDYEVNQENSVNYGIKDIPFFMQSIDKHKQLNEPYFAKFITLTNHFPFLLEEEDQLIEPANTEVGVVNRYVTTVRYQDEAIKELFEQLKEQHMYKDTIFVIYGDHYGISQKYEEGVHELLGQKKTPVNHMKLQQVPLIIHIPGQKGKKISTVGGQVGIRSTVLHLLGIPTEDKMSFSRNLFIRDNHPVIFRDGDMVTGKYGYMDNLCYSMKSAKQVSRDHCLKYQETLQQELELNDEIILGDLLRFINSPNS